MTAGIPVPGRLSVVKGTEQPSRPMRVTLNWLKGQLAEMVVLGLTPAYLSTVERGIILPGWRRAYGNPGQRISGLIDPNPLGALLFPIPNIALAVPEATKRLNSFWFILDAYRSQGGNVEGATNRLTAPVSSIVGTDASLDLAGQKFCYASLRELVMSVITPETGGIVAGVELPSDFSINWETREARLTEIALRADEGEYYDVHAVVVPSLDFTGALS